MIIASLSGFGKHEFAEKTPNTCLIGMKDLYITARSRILAPEAALAEDVKYIERKNKQCDYVLIPYHEKVIQALGQHGVEVNVIAPKIYEEAEIITKYQEQGRPESMIDLFIEILPDLFANMEILNESKYVNLVPISYNETILDIINNGKFI